MDSIVCFFIFVSYDCEISWSYSFGPRREKTCLWGFANSRVADQPAH